MGGWLTAAITGLSALGGALGGDKQKQETRIDQTQTPVYDPVNQAFRDYLINQVIGRTSSGPEFQESLVRGGLANISRTGRGLQNTIENILTSRGINRTTAGASALSDTSRSTGRSLTDFLNSIPLIMDERERENLAAASALQTSLPVGSRTMGTTTGDVSGPGGLTGAFMGGGAALAQQLGQLSAQKQWEALTKQRASNNSIPEWARGN